MLARVSHAWRCCLVLAAALPITGCNGAASLANGEVTGAIDTKAGNASQDWPVFRGNAQSTGVATSTLPEKLELLWKYPVENGAFEATPVVVDGVVYVGDLDGTFYAIDLHSGQPRWKFIKPVEKASFNSAAAVRDGRVYVGDVDGNFYCLDVKSGDKLWAAKAEGEINSAANFHKDNVLFGSQDATLYCLNAKTGERQWTHTIGDQIRCSPTVIEDRCFLAGCDGKLHIINLNDGLEVGAVEIESPTGSTPAAGGDFIYFGSEGATFFCINWREAKEIWRWRDKSRNLSIRSSAALTDEAVIFGGHDKILHALDLKTGQRRWDFPTKGRIEGSPVVVGNRVFVGSADGRIYGVNVHSGEKVWEYEAGGKFTSSPAVAEGRMLIASEDGVVYCFGEKK
jgi:outer membrane protein assembly factor BamB